MARHYVKLTSTRQVFQVLADNDVVCGVHIGNFGYNTAAAEQFAIRLATLLDKDDNERHIENKPIGYN